MADTIPTPGEQTALLPSAVKVQNQRKPTPLPKLQLAIVVLVQLCEPIASQSIYPYINQLVSELDITGGDERKVGYYAGLIESLFFATEALTVLQWGRTSDKIGRKSVLLIGLIGTSLSILCFGLSRTFWALVLSRCLCGLLNGDIGVMKSVMGELTDSSNRAQGFALLPMVWCAGATLGPLMGGSLSKPYERFPTVFTSQFWKDYPYFLPCLAASSFTFVAIVITAVFFKETLPKRKRVASITSETTVTDFTQDDAPLPLRDVLVYPVIVSVANYVALAFTEIMLNALLPLFFAMPVEIGGLGFSPPTIGYIWGGYGGAAGIFTLLFFAKIVRRFGEKRVYVFGLTMFPFCFISMPIMNLCARNWGVGPLVWTILSMVIFMMVLMNMSFGCIFIYITASAPNKRALGTTNGLSQTTVSIARAIGPALSTSLFSYSVQFNVLGGYGVYLLTTIISIFTLALSTLVPTRVWEEKDTTEE